MQKKGMVCFIYYKPFHPKINCLTVNYSYNKFYLNGELTMPTISYFRGIKIYINWNDHMPPHFHASYAGEEIIVSINDIEVLEGQISSKQQKMVLGWAAFHQTELLEDWELAASKQELFPIAPLN